AIYYNKAGLKQAEVDARGFVTKYSYDNGRLHTVSDKGILLESGASTQHKLKTVYDYDSFGRLERQTKVDETPYSPDRVTSYFYDHFDRVIETNDGGRRTLRRFDAAGN